MPAVMDGVSSFATTTVPFGAAESFTSFTPSKMLSILVFKSFTSAALCCVSSSSVAENMEMNISHIYSSAASAH